MIEFGANCPAWAQTVVNAWTSTCVCISRRFKTAASVCMSLNTVCGHSYSVVALPVFHSFDWISALHLLLYISQWWWEPPLPPQKKSPPPRHISQDPITHVHIHTELRPQYTPWSQLAHRLKVILSTRYSLSWQSVPKCHSWSPPHTLLPPLIRADSLHCLIT